MTDNVTMARAEELVDTWVNGNRTDVMEALVDGLSCMETSLLTGFIVHEMWERLHPRPEDAQEAVKDFLRMVARRV
jgi:hypothetical protein